MCCRTELENPGMDSSDDVKSRGKVEVETTLSVVPDGAPVRDMRVLNEPRPDHRAPARRPLPLPHANRRLTR